MFQHQLFDRVIDAARAVLLAFLFVTALIILVAALNIAILLHIASPYLLWGFLAIVGFVLLLVPLRLLWLGKHHRTLFPPVGSTGEKASYSVLKAKAHHSRRYMIRLSLNQQLPQELQQLVRQLAYDLDESLNTHPLRDDLIRATNKAEASLHTNIIAYLDKRAFDIERDKLTSVVEDVIQPPFPMLHPLIVLYHEMTMISDLTEIYLGNPTLREYWIVIRDSLLIMTRGDYFRIGQRLFAGVYANSPPMGQAIDDFGNTLTSIWITRMIAQAVRQRCLCTRTWTPVEAIEELDGNIIDSLLAVRQVLTTDAMPFLKSRLRHCIPPGTPDVNLFSEALLEGVTKSIDSVVQSMRSTSPRKVAHDSRRTYAGITPAIDETKPGRSPRKRRLHQAEKIETKGIRRIFKTVMQRLRYSAAARFRTG